VLYPSLKLAIVTAARLWFRLVARGQERVPRTGGVLLAANHESLLDPPLIGSVVPREIHFMAKAELFRVPLLGPLVRRLNAHPVERGGSDAAALRLALRILHDGHAILVFPEGTRGTEGRLRPGRPGAGMLAALAETPVVPVYVAGSGRALPRGAILPRPRRVRVHFGAPIRFASARGKARYQEISDEIMAAIGRLKAESERDLDLGRARTDPTTPGPAPAARIH
jgi:1-acyl-sn-glycerol-3-phosphate acyltransferase